MPRKINIQEKVQRLREFYQRENRVPGYAEMMDIFEYRSKNAVFALLVKLIAMGYLTKNKKGKLAFTNKLTGRIKLFGMVQAGFPSPAEEELIDTISLDEYLVQHPETTFMLTVSGDSMIDAGIQPGDIVLVEKGKEPQNNDIVIAQVEGEWTMKYFFKKRTRVTLEPANRRYKPIIAKKNLVIGGVVTAVIRKYGT